MFCPPPPPYDDDEKDWIIECVLLWMGSLKLYDHLRKQKILILPRPTRLHMGLATLQLATVQRGTAACGRPLELVVKNHIAQFFCYDILTRECRRFSTTKRDRYSVHLLLSYWGHHWAVACHALATSWIIFFFFFHVLCPCSAPSSQACRNPYPIHLPTISRGPHWPLKHLNGVF